MTSASAQRRVLIDASPPATGGGVLGRVGRSHAWVLRREDVRVVGLGGDTDTALESIATSTTGTWVVRAPNLSCRRNNPTFRGLIEAAQAAACVPEVVLTVRHQTVWITDHFCRRVIRFEPTPPFMAWVERGLEWGRFNLARRYQECIDDPGVGIVAIHGADMWERKPGAVLASLVGLSDAAAEVLANDSTPWVRPVGPTTLTAARFYARMARVEGADIESAPWRATSSRLWDASDELGWNRDQFWGWDAFWTDAVAGRYGGSNDAFARSVWGTSWFEELPRRPKALGVPVDELIEDQPTALMDLFDKVGRITSPG